jgi:hypothetical protein
VVDILGPMENESRDLNERRRGSVGVLGEEGGSSEEEDGFDGIMPFFGYWNIYDYDSDDDHYGSEDVGSSLDVDLDDSSDDETTSVDL